MPIGVIAGPLIAAGIHGLFQLFSRRAANKAAKAAENLQYDASLRSLAMQETANREQLAFLKDQEAARQREYQSTQNLNLRLYGEEVDRREPFRRFAAGSLRQLSQPIYGPGQGQPGSLRGMMR